MEMCGNMPDRSTLALQNHATAWSDNAWDMDADARIISCTITKIGCDSVDWINSCEKVNEPSYPQKG
jgi:hypothetical protein